MKLDMAFTQDAEWIKKRQEAWEEIEDSLAEGHTKKQFEAYRSYFFTGVKPKIKLAPSSYPKYFPKIDKEGLAYVFSEYIASEELTPRKQQSIESDFSQNLDLWPGASFEEKINLYRTVYGEVYNPSRKFPFLIGDEAECREFIADADDLFVVLTNRFRCLFIAKDDYALFWAKFTDYYISIIPYIVNSWIFKLDYSKEQNKIKIGNLFAKGFHSRIDGLFENLIAPPKHIREGKNSKLKLTCREQLYNFFDNVREPAELVERWRWAKQEYGQ